MYNSVKRNLTGQFNHQGIQNQVKRDLSGCREAASIAGKEGIVFVKDKVDFKKYGWRDPAKKMSRGRNRCSRSRSGLCNSKVEALYSKKSIYSAAKKLKKAQASL